ncbi:MAG: prenyltransferase/squalene oxidase repeat-containing protein [Gemmatales bacterium]
MMNFPARFCSLHLTLGIVVVSILACSVIQAEDPLTKEELETQKITAKYRQVVEAGLQWLSKNQSRDGHWDVAPGGAHPIPMTALAGLALLSEGSTMSQGKYSKEIELAVEYLLSRVTKKTGLIGDTRDQREQQRYMYGHGFATLFLAQVYGEEPDGARRKELEKVLTQAVIYIGKAQTALGGWGYLTAAEGTDFDEGSVTITQLQALRACKNAGIPVPKEVIDKAGEYLRKSSVISSRSSDPMLEEAGVTYSLRGGGGGGIRPPLTAAGICCLFSSGEYNNEMALKWINYCQRNIHVDNSGRDSFGHWEYTHLYYSQVLYVLGEDRHAKMRPDLAKREAEGEKKLLKWSRYREVVYGYLAGKQSPDGSWNSGAVGPVYSTALHLIILQLDKGHLPIFQR